MVRTCDVDELAPRPGSRMAMEERPRAPRSILRALGPSPWVFAVGAVATGSVAADLEVLAEDQKLLPSCVPEAQRLDSVCKR